MLIDDQNLNNRLNNFDFLRLAAAFLVLIGHAPLILGQSFYSWDPFKILFGHNIHAFGVVVFFIISGFLVSMSWERHQSAIEFLRARILRIFPGLVVAILFSVLFLGVFLTNKSLLVYLTDFQTYQYLFNMSLLRISYNLPGVFENNPIGTSINGSIWSLPYEFCCYLLLLFTGLLTKRIKRKYLLPILYLGTMIFYFSFQNQLDSIYFSWIDIRVKILAPYALYFFVGSIYYQLRKQIPYRFGIFILAILLCLLIQLLGWNDLITILILPYVILYLAFSPKINLRWAGKKGDLSYGVYLYAFPIQQTLVYFLPNIPNVAILILLTILIVLPLAYFSWNFVEKPALKWKN